MKKIISGLALAAVATIAMTSCNNQPQKNDTTEPAKGGATAEAKFAYVEIDSILSQYKYAKEADAILKEKGTNIQNTLQSKQQSVQQAAANFQQNIQQNKYTQQQAQQIQANIQKQAQDADALSQRLQTEYANEQAQYQTAIIDSTRNFIARYNKDKKYTMIFVKQGDNILYADKSCDITDAVVAGMNKAYTGMKKEAKK